MAPSLLPQIRVSDIEILGDWDLENVKAFGDSIPGYQMSASESFRACHPLVYPFQHCFIHDCKCHTTV